MSNPSGFCKHPQRLMRASQKVKWLKKMFSSKCHWVFSKPSVCKNYLTYCAIFCFSFLLLLWASSAAPFLLRCSKTFVDFLKWYQVSSFSPNLCLLCSYMKNYTTSSLNLERIYSPLPRHWRLENSSVNICRLSCHKQFNNNKYWIFGNYTSVCSNFTDGLFHISLPF